MPQAIDSERGVLGLVIVWGEFMRDVRHRLDADMFYTDSHKTIWKILQSLDTADSAIDQISVTQALKANGMFGEIGGETYLSEVAHRGCSRENLDFHVSEIRKAFFSRKIVESAQRIAADPEEDSLVSEIQRLALSRAGESGIVYFDVGKDIDKYIEKLSKDREIKSGQVLNTGFTHLDSMLGGLKRGDLMTVSARPGGGKTAFMTRAGSNLADQGYRILMFTTEMAVPQFMPRILSYKSGVHAWRFRKLALEDKHIHMMKESAESLRSYTFFVCDKARPSLAEIKSGILRTKPDVVIIDYLQRIQKPRAENVTRATDEIMASIKTFCIEHQVLALLGCQMNRIVDRESGMPRLSDLRDGGSIESESDQVLLLHTDNAEQAANNILITGLLEKNRHGRNGTIQFILERDFVEFMEGVNDPIASDGGGRKEPDSSRTIRDKDASVEAPILSLGGVLETPRPGKEASGQKKQKPVKDPNYKPDEWIESEEVPF